MALKPLRQWSAPSHLAKVGNRSASRPSLDAPSTHSVPSPKGCRGLPSRSKYAERFPWERALEGDRAGVTCVDRRMLIHRPSEMEAMSGHRSAQRASRERVTGIEGPGAWSAWTNALPELFALLTFYRCLWRKMWRFLKEIVDLRRTELGKDLFFA
ncbi:hypothetical protein Pan216_27500 [Planctomycetes bacterium Pan216]|uniref:Uncharacterized protein n=1 Tax=Kolteria novifilia TaxID=2527975 RepID=A0A518B4I3_9BACT|nr:hypothetical protein Pan216_27500 [Planctomycetes bacterium Pan216]